MAPCTGAVMARTTYGTKSTDTTQPLGGTNRTRELLFVIGPRTFVFCHPGLRSDLTARPLSQKMVCLCCFCLGFAVPSSHFVTGDGGFINAFVSGFGGLMLGGAQSALRLSRPTVPLGTGGLRFKGLDYLGGVLECVILSDVHV